MADDEQFSLCWNNFNTNLSAGFHESLCRGDLVDVTLAAEGQMVKAHRLVLSVCSPYFRKMFTQMPANQHAFVFLKDVSHSALKDLIQFMYCGEVNVKHDALPAFISTAEALQIKGLTETAEATTTASPAKAPTPAPSASSTTSPRSRAQRNISRTSYKLESEDSNDERPIIVPTQKRVAQRSVTPQSAPAVKRIKNIDPLEAAEPIQETVTPDKSEEPEFIDLPIESIPTKSEPEYADDSAEVESGEQEANYVEDDSYGDMKYDESYFTENDEVKAGVSGFSESYTTEGDQSATEAQALTATIIDNKSVQKNIGQDLIPLHAGSNVYVPKRDLIRIYTTKPAIYTGRLAQLIFGKEQLVKTKLNKNKKNKDILDSLDKIKLKSLLTHVVQVYQRRGLEIDQQIVESYLRRKINRVNQQNNV